MEKITESNHLDIVNFTNVDNEDFVGHWGRKEVQIGVDSGGKPDMIVEQVPYLIKAGETKPFPRFMAYHFTKHLANKILQRKYGNPGGPGRDNLEARILGGVSVEPETIRVPEQMEEFAEAPKEEVKIEEKSKAEFICEKCGKEFKMRVALAGHSRTHK